MRSNIDIPDFGSPRLMERFLQPGDLSLQKSVGFLFLRESLIIYKDNFLWMVRDFLWSLFNLQ